MPYGPSIQGSEAGSTHTLKVKPTLSIATHMLTILVFAYPSVLLLLPSS